MERAAYEHILTIRGTGYGMVSEEDLRMITVRYGLTDRQIQTLSQRLRAEGIEICSTQKKNDVLDGIRQKNCPPPPPEEDDTFTDAQILEEAAKRGPSELAPELQEQIKCIAEGKRYTYAISIITEAMVKVGTCRARQKVAEAGEKGLVFETYVNQIKACHHHILSGYYDEEHLNSLVRYCVKEHADEPVMEALLTCFAHSIHPIHVDRY